MTPFTSQELDMIKFALKTLKPLISEPRTPRFLRNVYKSTKEKLETMIKEGNKNFEVKKE